MRRRVEGFSDDDVVVIDRWLNERRAKRQCPTCYPYVCVHPAPQPVPPPPVLEQQWPSAVHPDFPRAGNVVVIDQRLVDAGADLGGPAAVIGAAFFISWMLGLATEPLLCFACSIQSAVILRLAMLLRGKQQRALTPSPTGLPSTSTAVDER